MAIEIRYVTGDATAPVGEGPKVIVHVCNDVGGWGRGFVVAISKRWKAPEAQYRAWHRGQLGEPFELGRAQIVEVAPELWVANVIGQRGLKAEGRQPPIRYEAVRAGLARVREHALATRASVHMPRIGCGLAGGTWAEMQPIIDAELGAHDIEVCVYDLP